MKVGQERLHVLSGSFQTGRIVVPLTKTEVSKNQLDFTVAQSTFIITKVVICNKHICFMRMFFIKWFH